MSKMPTTFSDIDQQATEWFAIMDSGAATPDEMARFEAWIASDPRALGAYCRVEGVMSRLDHVGEIAREDLRGLPSIEKERWTRRRIVLTGSAAASIAAAGAVGAALLLGNGATRYATRLGEVRACALADGSIVTLNTNSEIAVRYAADARRIDLVRGEALFDVAKNKTRPFVVHAGATQVRAVGTSFSVSMLPEHEIQVLVKEGVVELRRENAVQAIPVRVKANVRALVAPNNRMIAAALPQTEVVRDLAWKYGQLAFENQTLGEAAQSFARYNDMRIVIDPAVADRTITGIFASNDPVGFAKMSAAALGLKVEVTDAEVKILDRPRERPVGVK
jgi:transmembrane sensor